MVFCSCAPNTPETRIGREPEKFAALGLKDQELVRQGKIRRGMPPEAVELAWGAPARRFQGSKNAKPTERWDYAGSQPVYFNNFYGGYGYAYGGYGPYGAGFYPGAGFGLAPEVVYVPYLKASVWFTDSRVDSWEQQQ